MNKSQTAEEFLRSKGYDGGDEPSEGIKELLIEFAKLHVEAALEAVRENIELKRDSYFETSEKDKLGGIDIWEEDCDVPSFLVTVNKDSILNAYPLDLIK